MYTHFKKARNSTEVVILNILIRKDEYKSRLTSAITSGYHQRLDTSDYDELLLLQHTFFGTSVYIVKKETCCDHATDHLQVLNFLGAFVKL